ncbi:MAG: rRNA maturation RNase YbeY [Tannerella sp.]|jgi:rRNA maturation RNase YbeY|nr:rRNA maturation RNase YbeY [Tannerella sp.]
MITYNVDDIKMPVFPKRKISLWIKQVAEDRRKRVGEIAYVFCSDHKILELNRAYLNHDYYTDIITFDYSENDIISGDIFISVDTVRTNAEQLSVGYCNELYRVIIHGILHLCGIEDKTPEARIIMESNEDSALKMLYDRWIKSDSPSFYKCST